jgi:hypothetical protein
VPASRFLLLWCHPGPTLASAGPTTCLCPQRLAQSRPCSETGAPAPPPELLEAAEAESTVSPCASTSARARGLHRRRAWAVAGEELGVGDTGELGTDGANSEGAAAPPPLQREASRAPAACAPWTGAWSRGARNRGARCLRRDLRRIKLPATAPLVPPSHGSTAGRQCTAAGRRCGGSEPPSAGGGSRRRAPARREGAAERRGRGLCQVQGRDKRGSWGREGTRSEDN